MSNTLFKEDLSFAYLRAVAAMANITFEALRRDQNGVDVKLSKPLEMGENKIEVEMSVQLKSTCSSFACKETDTEIIYQLKGKTYNDLICKRAVKLYLMLLILPVNKDEWAEFNEEEAILRRKMYWISFENSTNTIHPDSTKTIHIPKINLVNPQSLNRLMELEGEKYL